MNHLESSFEGKNGLWRYVVMVASVLIASNTVGALPLIISYAIKSAADPGIITELAKNPNNLSVLGLDPNLELFMMLFPFLAALVTFILLIKPLNQRNFKITINGTSRVRWKRLLVSALVWLLLSAAYFFIYLKIDPSNFTIENTSASILLLILITLILIPFQAAFEEVLFRGYLMQGLAVIARNRWLPVIITSLLFGLMHAFNPEVKEFGFFTMMPQYFLFGLIFGIITILDDGIEAAIGAHAANNIFLCVMVTNNSSALQTPAIYRQHNVYPWTEFTGLLITGVIFVLILKVIFRWESFRKIAGRISPQEKAVQIP